MAFTDKEKKTAQSIVENEAIVDLLSRIFLETQDKFTPEFIASKNNEELGELLRADSMAETKIVQRFNRLKQIGESLKSGGSKKVPK